MKIARKTKQTKRQIEKERKRQKYEPYVSKK